MCVQEIVITEQVLRLRGSGPFLALKVCSLRGSIARNATNWDQHSIGSSHSTNLYHRPVEVSILWSLTVYSDSSPRFLARDGQTETTP
jgi:hypothetical protein